MGLQKAFGTTNHTILYGKPLPIGFSRNTVTWCQSYLAERHFTVEVAKFANISCRVPQSSILGHLQLFDVNDMSQADNRKTNVLLKCMVFEDFLIFYTYYTNYSRFLLIYALHYYI